MPNHDNERTLESVLERLAANTTHPNTELVVVDDGSTDRSREILTRWSESGAFLGDVNYIEKPNSGAIDTLNAGLGAATGEFCVQLDSDASVETPGWIERMLGLMQSDERVGVVTAKVVMDSGYLHACGVHVMAPEGMHDRPTKLLEPVGRRRWHHRVDRYREGEAGATESEVAEVDSGIGCCMMYRREDAVAAGGYDSAYSPVWFDDIDLCISIRRLGRKVFYLPDVRVIHHLVTRGGPTGYDRIRPSRFGRALVRRAARKIPYDARSRIEERFDVDLALHYTPAQRRRLEHHYAYWREKWGWDVRNPDLGEIARRWGGTEVNWAQDPDRRAAGEEIARRYAAVRAAA
jgi:GT2 family glycosyltransferase